MSNNMLFNDDVNPSRAHAPAHAGEQSPVHKGNQRPLRPTEHLNPLQQTGLGGTVASSHIVPHRPTEVSTPLAATSSATPAAPAARKVPRVPGAEPMPVPREVLDRSNEIGPCPTCGCPLAWESIYRDGIKKCEQCYPPPSRRIVGERWAIVTAAADNGTPTHSWQPLRDCWRHAAAERDRLEGEAAALVRSDSGEREAV